MAGSTSKVDINTQLFGALFDQLDKHTSELVMDDLREAIETAKIGNRSSKLSLVLEAKPDGESGGIVIKTQWASTKGKRQKTTETLNLKDNGQLSLFEEQPEDEEDPIGDLPAKPKKKTASADELATMAS